MLSHSVGQLKTHVILVTCLLLELALSLLVLLTELLYDLSLLLDLLLETVVLTLLLHHFFFGFLALFNESLLAFTLLL